MLLAALLISAVPAAASTIRGVISDPSGARLAGARVVLRDVATGRETVVLSGTDGTYTLDAPVAGTYLVIVTRAGFSEAARTIVLASAEETVTLPFQLELGALSSEVNVTAARSAREVRQTPLHVETLTREAIAQTNPLSTGDALGNAVNVTPVGNGPFGVRPRLRGLDSTRLLVLVDGERLNTARQATDRTGAEVGLVSPDDINRLEIVSGAGTLLYGSDALAGTINVITNEPSFSPKPQLVYGFNGYYSSNEIGRRGTLTFGVTAPKYAVRVQGGSEQYDNYKAGALDVEDTRPLFENATLTRTDTIDTNFHFNFKAFPDPFNAPYVRTDREVPNSQANATFVNASALVALGDRRTLKLRYQQRRINDAGFPDFAAPYFFNATSLPQSDFDRVSARYEARTITPWFTNLSVTAYYQRTERVLENVLPVQFPAPTPVAFFPIAVMRLDILSSTAQRVWTPGVDVVATLTPARNHLLTTGMTGYRDLSRDNRTTSTQLSMVGQVGLGAFGPAATVFPTPIPLGPPTPGQPVRVPDARLRDIGVFAQDEWRIHPKLSLVGGLRGDFYKVITEPTPGYDVDKVVAGAVPPIDPATLPDPNGASYTRSALTGDIALTFNAGGTLTPFIRYGRSYRHPNLEEMLFAGPATIGSIAPNVTVRPEIGKNFDVGTSFRVARVNGGVYGFVNRYSDFIAQDLVVASTPDGPLAQATNYADVRIGGVEMTANAPIAIRPGVLTLAGAAAFMRGTIAKGDNPLDGASLDGTPADNITPARILASVRFTQPRGRWWVEYGVRTQSDVTRVASTLLDSPFLIAQDLLSLDGYTVQRLGWGIDLSTKSDRVGLTFAIENLANTYYREQFQFAPARGRSFTVGFAIGAF